MLCAYLASQHTLDPDIGPDPDPDAGPNRHPDHDPDDDYHPRRPILIALWVAPAPLHRRRPHQPKMEEELVVEVAVERGVRLGR